MQKVLRRTALAKNQGKRKAQIAEERKHRIELHNFKQESTRRARELRKCVQEEQERRRENWKLGPLSQWRRGTRDALLRAGEGVFPENLMSPLPLVQRNRPKDFMIREGDRVCVVEGYETVKGSVGEVTNVNIDTCTVTIKGVNRVDVRSPGGINQFQDQEVQTTERPVPFSHIRLVYPLPDPVTGTPRDCILTKLVARNRRFDKFENEHTFERWLEPQHLRIPWPQEKEPEYNDEPMDTLRIDSEEQSFLPTLLRPPMPMGIIDELRNKYSKYRDRHDDEWLEKKTLEDEALEKEEQRMWTLMPRSSKNIARSRSRTAGRGPISGMTQEKRPPPQLSRTLAAQIGKHMRENGLAPKGEQILQKGTSG